MKRFYDAVTTEPVDGGFQICLDGRPVRTPLKALLVAAHKPLADAVVQEWASQDGEIDLMSMPLTALLNVAADHVESRRDEVVAEIASYIETDLLCYRDDKQAELQELQEARWQPVLDWADSALSIRLSVTGGVLPISQPPEAKRTLVVILEGMDPLALTAMLKLAPLFGSALLGLAVIHGRFSAEEAYDLSVLEDVWQEQKWGQDDEASQRRASLREEGVAVGRLLVLGGVTGRL